MPIFAQHQLLQSSTIMSPLKILKSVHLFDLDLLGPLLLSKVHLFLCSRPTALNPVSKITFDLEISRNYALV